MKEREKCAKCPERPAKGRTMCPKHLRLTSEYSMRTRARWVEEGRCRQCGKLWDDPRLECDDCAASGRECKHPGCGLTLPRESRAARCPTHRKEHLKAAQRRRYRARGARCTKCGEPRAPGKTLCTEHLRLNVIRVKKSQSKRKIQGETVP